MKSKFFFFAMFFLLFTLLCCVQVVAADFSWRDDFNYANIQDMQIAGWVLDNPSGTSLQTDGVVIDGTASDTVIRYRGFPSGLYDWRVETRSMWIGGKHSCPGLDVITEKHVYSFSGNGWSGDLNFDRDGVTMNIGGYADQTGWVTMAMAKQGNSINLYLNGELVKTYTEMDTSPSGLLEVDRIAPWKGVMVYDYYQVTDVDVAAASGDFPLLYVGIAGGVTAAVVGSVAAYVFLVSKGGSAAAAGAGSSLGGAEGGGSDDSKLVADANDEKTIKSQINNLKSNIDKLKSNLGNGKEQTEIDKMYNSTLDHVDQVRHPQEIPKTKAEGKIENQGQQSTDSPTTESTSSSEANA